MIDDYFRLLEDWKLLPAYKLEVRIDSLVGFALPKVLEDVSGRTTQLLIPELPLRLGTLRHELEDTKYANRSYKVDFYVLTQRGENLFVEFKTDSGSRREKQDEYLKRSMEVGMTSILEGIVTLSKYTPYKKKYEHLLSKLGQAGLVDHGGKPQVQDDEVRVMYIQPMCQESDDPAHVLDFDTLGASIAKCFPTSELMTRLARSIKSWGTADA
jgi:hypothetical protein